MKLAVHLHLYYLEQLPEILGYLNSLAEIDYDLFVTMVKSDKGVEEKILALHPQAKIMVVPNRGYDLGPFVEFLHKIDSDKYDLVLKVHTKGNVSKNYTWLNGRRLDNRLWGQILWDALLKNKERVQKNIAAFNDKKVGMLSSAYCLAKEKLTYQKLLPAINKELNAMGLASVESVRFVAGTMFYARPQIFKPMLRYEIGDFEESSSEIKEGTMAHVAERLLGVLTEQSGFEISAIKHDGYSFRFALTAIKRFLFQKKITTSGHLIVKVCHLPVLHWKGYRV